MNYLRDAANGAVQTPQTESMRADQVENSAGGFGWAVDSWTRLRRFLILGSEGGSYYAGERKLTGENVDALRECVTADAIRTVDLIVEVSDGGLAPKNDPAIFALAYTVANADVEGRQYALDRLEKVCRIGTHLFTFCDILDRMGHLTGRAKRRALGRWYTGKTPDDLAYQLVKYRQRGGWTHRDVLRLSHPKATGAHAGLVKFAVGKADDPTALPKVVNAFLAAQESTDPAYTARLIADSRLPREAIRPEQLTSPEVWQALLDADMPMTALIRNLANMTRIGLLTPTAEATRTVVAQLADEGRLRKARVHPLAILFALKTYASGRGFRSDNTWSPVPKIVDALDAAFYLAFGNVEPTGKRTLLALDASGSMDMGAIAGSSLTPREGSAAMALVTAAVEDAYECVAFSHTLVPVPLSARQRLDDVIAMVSRIPMGGTDCSLPMLYALEQGREIDTFIVYTDSETWAGRMHPAQALAEYRRRTGIQARLVVVGMVSNGFTIADPQDQGMLDVVGFDASAPQVMSDFARGLV